MLEGLGHSPAAAAGGFEVDEVVLLGVDAALGGEGFGGAVGADEEGEADFAAVASGEAVGLEAAAVAEESNLGVGEEFDFADEAVAAAELAGAPGVLHPIPGRSGLLGRSVEAAA